VNRHISDEIRDEIVTCLGYWEGRAAISIRIMLTWIELSARKFYRWKSRLGTPNKRRPVPKGHWLLDWEMKAIVEFARANPWVGYRTLTYMMLDADIVAVSPSSTYRVLKRAGEIKHREPQEPNNKGQGFEQPTYANEHWHFDFSYIRLGNEFVFLCTVFDGYSRKVIHWEVRQEMKGSDGQVVILRAKEKYPDADPRIITDRGSQFVGNDFKEFVLTIGATHVLTSPYYPQSNGKLERWHRTIKEMLTTKSPITIEDVRRLLEEMVRYYNEERLHSAIGYVTPCSRFTGKDQEVQGHRKIKLKQAREQRRKTQSKEPREQQIDLATA
jgi:transposase InsO family protein